MCPYQADVALSAAPGSQNELKQEGQALIALHALGPLQCMISPHACMQRTKAELEGEVSALTASLEALRSTSSGICQLAGEAAKAAELEAAAHQVRP